MSFSEEFSTVELLRASCAETRAVDAFALSLIKAERQTRKLVTHLVFQYPCFAQGDIAALKDKLGKNRGVYFEEMIKGFDAIYPISIEAFIGNKYESLQQRISEAIEYRNKIFHGQLTNKNLSRVELFSYVDDIIEWSQLLAEAAENEIGYNGFSRNSFQKSKQSSLHSKFKVSINSIEDYESFIQKNMQRT